MKQGSIKRWINPQAEGIVPDSVIFWFRRDLRLTDNAGLHAALRHGKPVVPLFIFDTTILDPLEDKADRRLVFIRQSLEILKAELEQMGSSLLVLHGDPIALFKQLTPLAVYSNRDYEPYARTRDEAVEKELLTRDIPFKTFKDQVIFECEEVIKDDGTPYTVFTPYSKRWKLALTDFHTKAYPTEKYFRQFKRCDPLPFPTLTDLGFDTIDVQFPDRVIKKSTIREYKEHRDFPGIEGTSKLSVHLRFGTVSIRNLVRVALTTNETWLNELIWREFYHMILWHFPATDKSFKPAYDRIVWRNDPKEFKAWCEGRTGYPMVDAGMRELNATGHMHNRVRMIVASFLTKHLLIDWRWGEAYFAAKLLDFDLAANNGGWQWAAGCGCDAAPYFRVFNPYIQTEKFDPDRKYIRQWVPEFESPGYPKPIVDHHFARDRVLAVYKDALGTL
ncbi:MAG TPA: deoxyribodipyrimidine photo-lyase [Cyclobacteriaceae bacterium]|nr:deoxyribodipyrimidine photo-lyase [Cyclobacteriaceae bacterium]